MLARLLRPTLLLLLVGMPLRAAEPQATFALKDGFLQFRVEQDGKGIDHIGIRVIDLGGQKLGEGDSDDQVEGQFPLPPRSTYLVGITIPGKKKEADIVLLRFDGKTISPSRVSLSFSKPCCRVRFSSQPDSVPETPPTDAPKFDKRPIAWIVLGVSGACMLAAGMMLMFFRRS